MGHIAQQRKQFKSINTYDYIITLIKKRKKPTYLCENYMVLHLNKLESPSPKDAYCQVWLKSKIPQPLQNLKTVCTVITVLKEN